MVDLGTLGGAASIARSVGANGDVAGRSTLADGSEHVFHWRAGVMTDTGIPSGFTSGMFVDARGRIAAYYSADQAPYASRAYFWDRGVVTDLGTLGGDRVYVTDLNDRGEVVGFATTAEGDYHAFLWRRGRMIGRGRVAGGRHHGDVVGGRSGVTATRGVVWRRDATLELGTLGRETSQGSGINDWGLAAGLTSIDPFELPRATAWYTGR